MIRISDILHIIIGEVMITTIILNFIIYVISNFIIYPIGIKEKHENQIKNNKQTT